MLTPTSPSRPQVKELGAVLYNCSCVASDLGRIFGTYRALGGPGTPLPAAWPSELAALSSLRRPLKLQLNGVPTQLFLSVSAWGVWEEGQGELRPGDLAAPALRLSVPNPRAPHRPCALLAAPLTSRPSWRPSRMPRLSSMLP